MFRLRQGLVTMGALAGVVGLAMLLQSAAAPPGQGQGYQPAGCWYANLYFGDPSDPATPKLPMMVLIDDCGTVQWTSTSSWGSHPYMPGNKGGGMGVWDRHGLEIQARGMWFDEAGGGLGLSIGRVVAELEFNGHDQLVGLADFDFVPCPDGELGCVDPTQEPFLQMGAGVGPFPIVYHRLR